MKPFLSRPVFFVRLIMATGVIAVLVLVLMPTPEEEKEPQWRWEMRNRMPPGFLEPPKEALEPRRSKPLGLREQMQRDNAARGFTSADDLVQQILRGEYPYPHTTEDTQ